MTLLVTRAVTAWLLAAGLAAGCLAAPPPPPSPAWIEDVSTQLLAKAMVEEARARTGQKTGDVTPTRADMVRALSRCLENTDNLLLLSGLRRVAPPIAANPDAGSDPDAGPSSAPRRHRIRRVIKLSDIHRDEEAAPDTDRF